MDIHINILGQMPTDKIVKHDNNPKKFVATTFIALVVLGGLFWWAKTRYNGSGNQQRVVHSKPLPKLSDASLAKIPQGFPRDYILGVNAEILSGTAGTTSGGRTSFKVDVRTDMAPRAIFADYLNFYTQSGWHITSQNISDNGGAISGDDNKGNTLLVVFESKQRTTVYHLSYVIGP